MPGIRDGNLRAGDLCEGFGLELLRPFAFVAPVPRTEDFGVDAVATLMRRDGRRLLAEESFVVQVKASSVRTIEFKGEALDWLRALSLPFYLLSVDLVEATLELRAIVNATSHGNYRDRKCVTLCLDETRFELSDGEMRVWLGPPILRWKPSDAANDDFRKTAYQVLKAWITFEMQCIGLRSIGMTTEATWDTNCVPKPLGGYAIMHHADELNAVLEKIRPHIQWLMMQATPIDEGSDGLLMGLLLVSQFMREHGVDPDPRRTLELFARMRAESGERSKGCEAK